MKKMGLSLLLTLLLALPAGAEMMDRPMMGPGCDHCQMMGGGGMGHGDMGHGDMGMGNMEMMGDMMGKCLAHADKIGLTDEQLKKIKPIHRAMEKKQAQFQADMKIARIDMMEIMDVKDFDLEKASAAVKKIGDLRTAHQLEMLKSMKDVHAILTDEQFQKMRKMMHPKMEGKKPEKKKPLMKKKP